MRTTGAAGKDAFDAATRDFLTGGGEMGALIRQLDWARMPLGVPAHWPQSLKTAVSILLSSRYPMFVFWGRERVKIYNDAYRPITGSKHPWALGRPGAEVWPEIWDTIGPMVDRVMDHAESTWSDDLLLFMHRNGYPEEVYFTFSYSPIRDESGGVGGVFCACTETTTKILSERRLRTLRDLAAAPSEARTVLDACRLSSQVLSRNAADVPFALTYVLDGDLAQLACEGGLSPGHAAAPATVALNGDTAWPLGRAVRANEALHVSELSARFPELPRGPWPEAPNEAMVLPLADRGQDRPAGLLVLGISARRAFDPAYRDFFDLIAGQIGGSMANARASEEERRRIEALAEIDRAKTAFFSNVSHEFRTPLTLMLGPLEDALRDATSRLPDTVRERLEMALRNGLRLQKLVNTLLDFSRIEAGRMQASYEPTDLSAMVVDLASAFRSLFEAAGLSLDVDAPPLPEPIYVDREMFEKVVLNLLSNAFKFTLCGSVRVMLRWHGDSATLTVRDTGIGIPEDELPRVFDRFHRVPGARGRSFEGTGIGLALVRELVKAHAATIAAESRPGEGTAMAVTLRAGKDHLDPQRVGGPRTLASTAATAASFVHEASQWMNAVSPERLEGAHVPASASLPAAARGARVLVVDDNADMRDYLRRILASAGLRVETATDGLEALEQTRRAPADLIVSDIMMPNLDGYGLLHRVRADPAIQHVPTILLSARAGEEARVEGLLAGASDYLVKPFSTEELVARVGTQLEVARLRAAVRRERDKLSRLFESAPAYICVLRGPEHVFESANPLYRELVGHRELIGRTVRDALPEVASQGYLELLDGVYRTGEPYVGKEVPLRIEQGEGTSKDLYFTFVYQPSRDAAGAVDGIFVFASDVTEAVQARRALEDTNRSKDEFLAMLGHELRNPLAPMRLIFDAARMRGSLTLGEKQFHMLDRQTAALSRIVDDLLDVARITRGTIELRPEAFAIGPLVARSVDSVRALIDRRRHELAIDLPAQPILVHADPVRLEQVLVNLLSNAAKYTTPGGRIAITAEQVDETVVLSVRDNGSGLAADRLESIFKPFEQAARRLDHPEGGLGIGLTVVRKLVELHGGRVRAESPGLGQGSTFTVELPAMAHHAADAQREAAASRARKPRREDAVRVLIVDDNEDAAFVLSEIVTELSHVARVVHDGAAALEVIAEFAPQVVLLDIGLPGMDGYELAPRLRASTATPPMLVAVTGYGQPSDRRRSFDAGFAYHLVKPIHLDALARVLSAVSTSIGPEPHV